MLHNRHNHHEKGEEEYNHHVSRKKEQRGKSPPSPRQRTLPRVMILCAGVALLVVILMTYLPSGTNEELEIALLRSISIGNQFTVSNKKEEAAPQNVDQNDPKARVLAPVDPVNPLRSDKFMQPEKEDVDGLSWPPVLKRTPGEKDVIVYLAQLGHHSSYKQQTDGKNPITGLSKLNRSLTTLYDNYVRDHPCDVIVFLGEDEPENLEVIQQLDVNRPGLSFHVLRDEWWSLPHGLEAKGLRFWRQNQYSIGYRHMIQWYAFRIWPFLTSHGYTHVMRMDDDSYLYSKVPFNLFGYMRSHDKRYAFRQLVLEGNAGKGFFELVDSYIDNHTSVVNPERVRQYRKNRMVGAYNNWFMADMSFFMEGPQADLMKVIDESKLVYVQRTNDLIIQAVIFRLFLDPSQVHLFQDFTYEHSSLARTGCPGNGGMSRGVGAHTDAEWQDIVNGVRSRYAHNPQCKDSDLFATDTYVGARDIGNCMLPNGVCGFALKEFTGLPDTSAAVEIKQVPPPREDWVQAVLDMSTGNALKKAQCAEVKKVAEWNICWPPVAAAIRENRCLVYSFGISDKDPFTEFMGEQGCQVFAFDPARNHPHQYRPNVLFYQYGLVSGIQNETSYQHVHWGDTSKADYKTLREIQQELGHTASEITVLKIDCEGCEWNLFSDMEPETLGRLDQVLTEFHFTITLRLNAELAQRYAIRAVNNLNAGGFEMFHFADNPGARYDRKLDPVLQAAGVQQNTCCREFGLLRSRQPV